MVDKRKATGYSNTEIGLEHVQDPNGSSAKSSLPWNQSQDDENMSIYRKVKSLFSGTAFSGTASCSWKSRSQKTRPGPQGRSNKPQMQYRKDGGSLLPYRRAHRQA